MIAPLIISIVTALLCCGCLGVFLWQVGQALAGDTSWADASCALVFSQLGILFFGIFAIATWKNYKDEPADSKALVYLVLAFFLEVALLLGIKTGVDVYDRLILLQEGVETKALITRHERTGSGKNRRWKPVYQFITPDGKKIEDSISFRMTLSLPLGENFRLTLSSDDVTYRVGSTVPVRYMASAPECHVVLTFGELWLAPLGMGMMSLFIFGMMGYQIRKMHKRRHGSGKRRARRAGI